MKKIKKILESENFAGSLAKFILTYGIMMVIFILMFKYVFMLSMIPTGSMERTILPGDLVFATRYDRNDLERYDIVIFNPPDNPNQSFIKRLIGLPGETIEVRNGKVYADGVELDDSFVKNPMNRRGDGTYVVPEGCYFFMGDNRNQSRDSRFWDEKYVPIENIVAKAKIVLFPFSNFGDITYKGGD